MEEFVAVMPGTDAEGAHMLAERWRTNVAALALPHQYSHAADHVTISVGYASIRPRQDQSSLELLDMVDIDGRPRLSSSQLIMARRWRLRP